MDTKRKTMIEFAEDDWRNIFKSLTNDAYDILTKYKNHFRTKLNSEIISSLVVSYAEEYFNSIGRKVQKDRTDRDPDLFFFEENLPLEVKVTRYQKTLKWQGGQYSKRHGQFVLVSWKLIDNNLYGHKGLEFYAITCFLNGNDFTSLGENYYGTGFDAKSIANKDSIELVGKNFLLENFYYDDVQTKN